MGPVDLRSAVSAGTIFVRKSVTIMAPGAAAAAAGRSWAVEADPVQRCEQQAARIKATSASVEMPSSGPVDVRMCARALVTLLHPHRA
jgi:hypothetical protein